MVDNVCILMAIGLKKMPGHGSVHGPSHGRGLILYIHHGFWGV